MRLLIISFGLMWLSAFVTSAYAEDQPGQTVERKVCVINLKKDAALLMSQLEASNCKAGDVLYLAEIQYIGMTQHTTGMVTAQVCDFREQVLPFSLQSAIATICIYSGNVLQLGGSKGILKSGGFHKKPENLHTLIKD